MEMRCKILHIEDNFKLHKTKLYFVTPLDVNIHFSPLFQRTKKYNLIHVQSYCLNGLKHKSCSSRFIPKMFKNKCSILLLQLTKIGFLKYWCIGAILWNAREGRREKIVTEMHMWCDLYRTFERICRWKINSTPLKP